MVVTQQSSEFTRRLSIVVRGIGGCAVSEQEFDDLAVTLRGCFVQRRVPMLAMCVHLCAGRDQNQ